ncbi:alkane 1-monooxygenase [Actibacterium mucosum KCTC 23349]|uniref:Alkane 1-monooxygenase n=1 Tax=Actibacterium mucosum KCTC 23349 TaxID=1454373 RepID=A0A037ZM07_9RHOB|nr:alkane 1-monooxygenase [Actibacterium mucosum]KAJ57446.1 alkane 1-monooxygenase [Actibacterium mucosum KCTC 23349]
MSTAQISTTNALPFWISVTGVPLIFAGAYFGGWILITLPVYFVLSSTLLDALVGLNTDNADPDTPDDDLFWYRLVTLIWFPLQCATLICLVWWAGRGQLAVWEFLVLAYSTGLLTGGVGINYAHELMHQKNRLERWLGDLLMASVLYSHFRSEHLLVHHLYVGTPRDPVSARYNEGFHRFFPRVLRQCLASAWKAEKAMLARRERPVWHASNPFWRYGALQVGFLALALAVGGWAGLVFFVLQAFFAVLYLELTNYVEHYGLTRKHLGDGKYEHVQPRHSWNAAHRVTNWLLINLQRHSDHHYKPNRRFPLLQTYTPDEAPQLPLGYPFMTGMALIPPLWRRRMNPRVRAWRKTFYPEIEDWTAYNKGTLPLPKGS